MAYKRDKKLGDEGEKLVLNWLREKEGVTNIRDVSKDPQYQKKDIDILFTENGSEKQIDVKCDTMVDKTGNVFMEIISNNKKYTPGNFIYSEAQYFYYVFSETKRLLVLPLKETRDYVFKHSESFKIGRCNNYGYNGEVLYTSLGRLVPYNKILSNLPGAYLLPIQ